MEKLCTKFYEKSLRMNEVMLKSILACRETRLPPYAWAPREIDFRTDVKYCFF